MFSVFDLTCNGLRDPRGVGAPVVFSWRLGSDRQGARQAAYRVVVTSMEDGECCWDTGTVASDRNEVCYAGRPLRAGEVCVWFVVVQDDAGERAEGVPASFGYGGAGGVSCELGAQRLALVWTSDPELDDELESWDARDALWRVVGLRPEDEGDRRMLVAPDLDREPNRDLAFAQGSYLCPYGLVVARWERKGAAAELLVCVPPGCDARLRLGDQSQVVGPGRHVLP